MNKEIPIVNLLVLSLRFFVGIIIGSVLVFGLWCTGSIAFGEEWLEIPLKVSGLFILIVGISAIIWGDKFIFWFTKIFKYLEKFL